MTDKPTPTYVLGWRVDLRFNVDGFVFVGTVREHPQIVPFGTANRR